MDEIEKSAVSDPEKKADSPSSVPIRMSDGKNSSSPVIIYLPRIC